MIHKTIQEYPFCVTEQMPDHIRVVAYIEEYKRVGSREFVAEPIGSIFSQSGMHELIDLLNAKAPRANIWTALETKCANCGLELSDDPNKACSREIYFVAAGSNLRRLPKDRETRFCGTCSAKSGFVHRVHNAVDRIGQQHSGLSFLPCDL
jgi:hypothetical protein